MCIAGTSLKLLVLPDANYSITWNMEKLFVYGTLQPGGANESILADLSGNWEAGSVRGRLLDEGWGADLGYPGLVLDEKGVIVSGFVFSSPELSDVWAKLDTFEGQEYERRPVMVTLQTGRMVSANIYVLKVTSNKINKSYQNCKK